MCQKDNNPSKEQTTAQGLELQMEKFSQLENAASGEGLQLAP